MAIKKSLFAAALLLWGLVAANAQELIYKGADVSEAIRVKYSGAAGATTSAVTPLQINMNDGLVSNTKVFTNAALSDVIAGINAFTNQAGATGSYIAEYWAGISTDIASNNVMGSTNTLTAKTWGYVMKWDTSAALHYDVVGFGEGSVGISLQRIFGQPLGTGAITTQVYVADSKVYEWTHPGTQWYVSDASGTNYTEDNQIDIDLNIGGINVDRGKRCLVRVKRATTATTGILGATFDQK